MEKLLDMSSTLIASTKNMLFILTFLGKFSSPKSSTTISSLMKSITLKLFSCLFVFFIVCIQIFIIAFFINMILITWIYQKIIDFLFFKHWLNFLYYWFWKATAYYFTSSFLFYILFNFNNSVALSDQSRPDKGYFLCTLIFTIYFSLLPWKSYYCMISGTPDFRETRGQTPLLPLSP